MEVEGNGANREKRGNFEKGAGVILISLVSYKYTACKYIPLTNVATSSIGHNQRLTPSHNSQSAHRSSFKHTYELLAIHDDSTQCRPYYYLISCCDAP